MSSHAIDTGLLLLRIVAGLTMFLHGWQKVFAGGKLAGTGRWFDSIGMRPGRVQARAAAATEIAAGLAFAFGLFTAISGAAFVALMLVAGYVVHRHRGFFIVNSGWEYNLVLAAIGVAVAITGPGRYSLDAVLRFDAAQAGFVGLVVALGGGLLAGVVHLAVSYRPADGNAASGSPAHDRKEQPA